MKKKPVQKSVVKKNTSSTTKKMSLSEALRVSNKLQKKGFVVSNSVQKKIVSSIAREVAAS